MRAGQENVQRERRKSERVYLTSGVGGVMTFVQENYKKNPSVAYTELDEGAVLLNLDTILGFE